jgi:hypothetical protein
MLQPVTMIYNLIGFTQLWVLAKFQSGFPGQESEDDFSRFVA